MLADVRTGEFIAVLPMTSVTYSVGIYAGQDMTGTVYLPDMSLSLMVHPPSNDYERIRHPDQGTPLGSMFEVGNRAIYIMRNDEVVWGGILWTRAYSSGDKTMALTAMSWEGYIYYRALRKSVVFLTSTDKYTIWRALLEQVLAFDDPTAPGVKSDFQWFGDDGAGKNSGAVVAEGGNSVPWTGITRDNKSNQAPVNFDDAWPYSSPPIELPPANLPWVDTNAKLMGKVDPEWRGYDMNMVGDALQQWADVNTLITSGGFEYRVLCWWDEGYNKFRQRYTFGEMVYPDDNIANDPTAIKYNLMGLNIQAVGHSADNTLVFDFPGQISEWSLSESMEDAATRVIVKGNLGDGANSIVAYEAQDELLKGADFTNQKGRLGWPLYDKVYSYDVSSVADPITKIKNRADQLRKYHHPRQPPPSMTSSRPMTASSTPPPWPPSCPSRSTSTRPRSSRRGGSGTGQRSPSRTRSTAARSTSCAGSSGTPSPWCPTMRATTPTSRSPWSSPTRPRRHQAHEPDN